MRVKFFPIIIILLLISAENDIYSQKKDFSAAEFRKNLSYLGSDIFEGRGTGTLGGYLASKYLAYKFDEYKLRPIGDDGTYYQNIPFHASVPQEKSQLKIFEGSKTVELNLRDDYVMMKTGEQTYVPEPEKLVFVGYGIIAPEFDYNDYQYSDVENKIVVILEGEPHSENLDFFDGEFPTIYSYYEAKERIAISRGAKGCIFIPDKNKPEFNWQKIKNTYSFEDINLASNPSGNFSIILNPAKAESLFINSPLKYEDVARAEKFGAMKSFPLSTMVSFKGSFSERDFFSPNIVGMVPGSDPELKDSYLIISAHYDHLGIGPAIKGDSVYNGVFDNAMGVSAVLELAGRFSEMKTPPKRSVIFLLTTAEEKGLLGSYYYVTHPVVPLYKTVANLNVDGIAAFDEFKSVIGVGIEYSTLEEILKSAAESQNLSIGEIPPMFKSYEAFNKSDQISFANAGIPSMLVLDAPDYFNMNREEAIRKFINFDRNIYHTPFDDLSIPINYKAVIQHIRLLFKVSNDIANSEKVPEWKPGSPFVNERLRTIAEKR